MIYKATRLIREVFQESNQEMRIGEGEKTSIFVIGFPIQNGPSVSVHFTSRDDDNDVYVHMHGLLSNIAEDKRSAVMEAINECHKNHRYFKFVINDNGNLVVEYDFPRYISDELVGKVALEIIGHYLQICKETYPILTRALWT